MEHTTSNSRVKIQLNSKDKIENIKQIAKLLDRTQIEHAVRQFKKMDGRVDTYSDSTSYHVVIEGKEYPPMAVFGLALSLLLDTTIKGNQFQGGTTSECCKTFKRLGYEIRDKIKMEDEVFSSEHFILGDHYKKEDVFRLGGVTPRPIRNVSGTSRFENCVVLFVTLNKENKNVAHNYDDRFKMGGTYFQWESRKDFTPNSPSIAAIFQGYNVLLFARIDEKIKGKSQPFVYAGPIRAIEANYPRDDNQTPVEVTFNVECYKPNPIPSLKALYDWGPKSKVKNLSKDLKSIPMYQLTENTSPEPLEQTKKPSSKRGEKKRKVTDWGKQGASNRSKGLAGEKLVILHEQRKLLNLGREDLANKVEHVALDSDSAGYDILSFDEDGNKIYIEVKTTDKGINHHFFISQNEVKASQKYGKQYYIYRLYNFNDKSGTAEFYSKNGKVDDMFQLVEDTYKAYLK